MRPRDTSSAGVRMSYEFGSGMFPELRSGPAMSAMPCASVVVQPNGFVVVKLPEIVSG